MANQKIYTCNEVLTILKNCSTPTEINDVIDHIMFNAVQYIFEYGATSYNAMAFAIQEKLRQLEVISL